MADIHLAREVFVPTGEPTHTYVHRIGEKDLEAELRDYLELESMVVSVCGPSKTGKSVLIRRVLESEYIIPIAGVSIRSGEDIFQHVLSWMESPSSISYTATHEWAAEMGGSANGKLNALIASGAVEGNAKAGYTHNRGSTRTVVVNPMARVIKDIAHSPFVIFIDDFHYIREDIRAEVGQNIKAASDSGVKFVCASVPHRSDDVVRSNVELRGRVASVNIDYWAEDELVQIATKGFEVLNVYYTEDEVRSLAQEALGSPQLMQAICLNACFTRDIRNTRDPREPLNLTPEIKAATLSRTASLTDSSKMLEALHTGPKKRGNERKEHSLNDGTFGDVYRTVLTAIKQDPARLSFSYDEIASRVKSVCKDSYPVGSSIIGALDKMHEIAEEMQPTASPIAWDGATLDIVDPYFLFFLRFSNKMAKMVD